MSRAGKVAALGLLLVLLGHPLAAACACWPASAAEPSEGNSGCHEGTGPETVVEGTARDCCLLVPAELAPRQSVAPTNGSISSVPVLAPAVANPAGKRDEAPCESPPRSRESSRQAFFCVFLI